ncbi:MAG: hypothetical protein IPM64_17580 [Phycisphaerales bacterium]|nr:hypothetical protein [Phycisphaerales bacterium]
MSFLSRLVVYLEGNIANFESAMGKAEYLADKSSRKIEASIKAADAALIGFAAGAGQQLIANLGRSFDAMYDSTIKAAAALDDMAEKTGGTVERLSSFVQVAKIGGTSVELLETSLTKLAKGMAGADDETKGAGRALEALGVKAKDSAGNFRATDEVMNDVAKSLARYADGAGKAAIVQDLFGKSGAQLLPYLKDLIEYGGLAAKVTAEQAAQAEIYEKTLNKLSLAKQQLAQQISLSLLPVLQAVADLMLKAKDETGSFHDKVRTLAEDGSIRSWAEESALYVADVIDYFKTLAATLGAVGASVRVVAEDIRAGATLAGAAMGIFTSHDVSEAMGRRNAALEAANNKWEELLKRNTRSTRDALEEQLRLQRTIARAMAGEFDDARDRMSRAGKGSLNYTTGGEENDRKVKAMADALRTLAEIRGKALGIDAAYFAQFEKLTLLYHSGKLPLDEYREAVQQALLQHSEYGKRLKEVQDAHVKAADDYEKVKAGALGMVAGMEAELEALFMTNAEREISIRLRELEHRGIVQGSTDYAEMASRIRAVVEKRQALQESLSFWDELSNRAVGFADALTHGVGKAIDYLRQEVKRFGAELIAIFVKRWVLQLAASATGSTALSAAAGQVGANSVAGAAANWFGSTAIGGAMSGAWTSLSAGYAGSTLAAGLAGPTTAGATGLMGLGNTIGTAIAAIPVWGWIAAAIGALAYAFRDKGENWKGRLGFGAGASVYTTEGVFGREGFQNLQGDDAVNRQIQAFMASLRPLDQSIAARLTPGQMSAIQDRLAAYNAAGATRIGGQPAEFAFGRGDDTAAAQLTLEYLQQKYSAVFDEIDTKFADFIRGYTGKSEDLVAAIAQFADIINGLAELDIRGLDVEALRAFQAAGEELSATFQRVANTWIWFTDNFYTEAEKLALAQEKVNATFSSLGSAVPGSITAFRELVESIDLSTEEGRTLWTTLMGVAPSFLQVANAAANAGDAIDETTRALQEAARQEEIRQRQIESVVASRQQQLEDVRGARVGLNSFLSGLLTNQNLTVLDPMQRLSAARTQYEETLNLARAGDLAAAGSLGDRAQLYLQIAREIFASSGAYVDIFNRVTGDVSSIDDRLKIDQQQLEATLGIASDIRDVKNLLLDIRDGTFAGPEKIAKSIENAGAATERR